MGGKNFDFSKRFLPNKLTGIDGIACLNDDDKRKLNQIMRNGYCHLFVLVEEFIVPTITEEAMKDAYGDEIKTRSLLRFAEEEFKRQEFFRCSVDLFGQGFDSECGLVPGRVEVAKVVPNKSKLAVLILTIVIEWFTQLHYIEHVRDDSDLDGLFRDLLRFHWVEEAEHAKLDTLPIGEVIEKLTPEERETTIDEVIELDGAIYGLLAQQIGLNIETLEKVTGRMFTAAEKEEITTKTQRAWRWTFLVSGLEHPNVVKTVGELTTAGPGKIKGVAEALSA